MDLSSLLGGIRPTVAHDYARKVLALQSAYEAAQAQVPFAQFVEGLPASITGACLGGDAEDFYLTSLLGAALWQEVDVDPIAAAVLNHIVLQLNFMTRFIASPEGPESVVLDGDPKLFPIAMANGNVVAACQIAKVPTALPAWTLDNPIVKLNIGVLTWTPLDGVLAALKAISRPRIGCLFIQATHNDAEINLNETYASLRDSVSIDTFYVVLSQPCAIFAAIEVLQAAHPEAVLLSRVYDHTGVGQPERRAILIATGLPQIPDLILPASKLRPFEIVATAKSENANEVFYQANAVGEFHEWVHIKPPVAISSRTPLPEEARRRISDKALFPHSATILKGGLLVPSQTPFCNTFLHVTKDGEIIEDVGEAHNFPNTPTFQNAQTGEEGRRRGVLPIGEVMHVKGAAMPLTFTPGLHTFFSHFLLQCFPRVRVLRDMHSNARIIVDSDIRPKQLEMLQRVGYGPDKIILRPPGATVHADELIVPRPWPLVFSPYTLEIYDELIRTAGAGSLAPTRRILISREYRTTWRTMLTYPAVAAMLRERFDFEEVRPEKLTLNEEIHLYRDAKLMIGAEGAGLYSSCYGREGSTFISIADEDYIMPVIGSAASARGFNVAYVFGESLRADSDVRRRLSVGHSDYVVDPLAVAALVERVLGAE